MPDPLDGSLLQPPHFSGSVVALSPGGSPTPFPLAAGLPGSARQLPPPPNVKSWPGIATDNDRLIKCARSGLATDAAFAGAVLCSECDMVNKIAEMERRLPFRLTRERVRGHQDAKKKWHELTWMDTLNVRTDTRATDASDAPGKP